MRRWAGPLLAGLATAAAACGIALVRTPDLLMAAAWRRIAAGGANAMSFAPLATDRSRAIVRPSPDLAYASCPYDLADGPVRVEVPAVPAPYWSLSVFDSDTDVAFVRNNRDTGNRAISVVVARAGQTAPPGAEVVRVAGRRGIALVRVLVEDRARFAALDAARRGARCGPDVR
jgi:uncharacterized membrane protein